TPVGSWPPSWSVIHSPFDGTNEVSRYISTEVISFVNTLTYSLGDSSSAGARAPIVSPTQPTSSSILHTVTQVRNFLETSGSGHGGNQGSEDATPVLNALQEGAAEQAASLGTTPVRREEGSDAVAAKELASAAGQASIRGLLVPGEAVATFLNSTALRVRA